MTSNFRIFQRGYVQTLKQSWMSHLMYGQSWINVKNLWKLFLFLWRWIWFFHLLEIVFATEVLTIQFPRNGIQQRKNSWQDGVFGTTCPIPPGKNFTYILQVKDQIGSYYYFPSLGLHKAAGGFGSIKVYSRPQIPVPFPPPAGDHSVLVGDWFKRSHKVSSFPLLCRWSTSYLIQCTHFCFVFLSWSNWDIFWIVVITFHFRMDFSSMAVVGTDLRSMLIQVAELF